MIESEKDEGISMRRFVIVFILGVSLSGTLWTVVSSFSMPSAQTARPDRLWQQDRGAGFNQII